MPTRARHVIHVTVTREPQGTHLLSVWRTGAKPMALAAQRATQAECTALAARVVAAVHALDARAIGVTGPDLLDMLHAAERGAS